MQAIVKRHGYQTHGTLHHYEGYLLLYLIILSVS